MKNTSVILFLAVFLAVGFAQTEADHAEHLLESLYNDAVQNLSDLRANWEVSGGLLTENVQSWQETFDSQSEECAARDAAVNEVLASQQENEFKLKWIQDTIREKLDAYQKIYDDRCAANRNYISGLKNDKVVLRLIDFLRKALEAKEDMNLIERREFTAKFMQFLSLYHSNNTKALLKMRASIKQDTNDGLVDSSQYEIDNEFDVTQRTEEQIGDEHVDDNREQIEVADYENTRKHRDFASYKVELLQILDELEENIRKKVGSSQENEIDAGSAAAEYRAILEKELQELDAELYVQVDLKVKIERRLREVTAQAQACKDVLESVTTALNQARDEYESALSRFQEKQGEISEELEIFEYVLELYQSNVSGDEYREQLEDHVADGSYEGDYNDREVDSIEFEGEEKPQQQEEEIQNFEEEP